MGRMIQVNFDWAKYVLRVFEKSGLIIRAGQGTLIPEDPAAKPEW